MKELSDEELAIMAQNNDENATNALLSKYKYLVGRLSRSFFLIGGDMEDLVQEGMIGLYKAIMHFSSEKNVSFKTFASVCIKHQIQNAVKIASSQKNKILSSAFSVDNNDANDDNFLYELELYAQAPSPDDKILEKEKLEEMKNIAIKTLSPLEKKILTLYLKGYSYDEIAKLANINKKSIDNGLTRIKNKLLFLKDYNNYGGKNGKIY